MQQAQLVCIPTLADYLKQTYGRSQKPSQLGMLDVAFWGKDWRVSPKDLRLYLAILGFELGCECPKERPGVLQGDLFNKCSLVWNPGWPVLPSQKGRD